jgi:isoleucyl-tRNA synthetase
MTKELDQYDLSATCNELHDTIDSLTNWYIRLSRRRFSGKGEEEDRDAALQTLHDVLLTLSQVLAPFCPFVTDTMYLNLVSDDHGSVHLTDWPETRDLTAQEQDLLAKTRTLRGIVSLGMSLRSEKKIKVRQPLQSATFALPPGITLREEDRALLKQELNVKDVTALSDPGELGQAIALVDARKVGPRLGKRVQEIINAGKNGDFQEQKDGSVLIMEETMSPDEVSIQYRGKEGQDVAADHGIVVSLDTEITDTLLLEGQSRDLIRAIQQLRKESGLEFTDHISLSINGADNILSEHSVSIAEETNATLEKNNGKKQSISFEGDSVTVQFEKK